MSRARRFPLLLPRLIIWIKSDKTGSNWIKSDFETMSDILTAKSMPFASINSTNPRTNLWNFHENFLRIDNFEKLFFYFCFIPLKISSDLYGRMDGSKFWCFPCFPENSLLCVILRYRVYFLFHSEDSTLEWPMLWRITMNSLHNEGIYEWVS